MEPITALNLKPGRRSLPCKPWRTTLGPTGHKCYLTEIPTSQDPEPKSTGSGHGKLDVCLDGDHQYVFLCKAYHSSGVVPEVTVLKMHGS